MEGGLLDSLRQLTERWFLLRIPFVWTTCLEANKGVEKKTLMLDNTDAKSQNTGQQNLVVSFDYMEHFNNPENVFRIQQINYVG